MNTAGNRGQGQQGHQNRLTGGDSRTKESEGVVGAVTERAQEMASSVASAAGDAWDDVTACMRRYPLATFFTGVGLGLLLGSLLGGARPRNYLRGNWAGYPDLASGGGYPFAK